MKTASQVATELEQNKAAIFGNQEVLDKIAYGIEGYLRIQNAYQENALDDAFKKYFGYFYRMSRYVSVAFKERFFAYLQEMRNGTSYSFLDLADALYDVDNKHQLSFVTKLIHTTDTTFPIYDSLVKKVLDLPNVTTIKNKTDKMIASQILIDNLKGLYHQLLITDAAQELLLAFDKRFNTPPISPVKKLDFILWAYGSTLI